MQPRAVKRNTKISNTSKLINSGEPVQILSSTGKHSFHLNYNALAKVLLRKDLRYMEVVVLSVAGTFRKGKSFLLNFILRYLMTQGIESEEDGQILTGFSWCGGSDRHTTGIWMWNKPIIHQLSSGKQIAILLMDTQGVFDSKSIMKECATVFALSTLLSSIQIYNLPGNIQDDDLQFLHVFTEYGRLAIEETNERPFQTLSVLVRDWSYPYEYPFGEEGGEILLNECMKVTHSLADEKQQLRSDIISCYEKMVCFLMPHPGFKVATDPNFKGQLSDIEPVFLQYMERFLRNLFTEENLASKKVNGQCITCRDLFQYFKVFMNIYLDDQLPTPKTIYLATAEANHISAVLAAKELYCKEMEKVCGASRAYITPEELEKEHDRIVERVIDVFHKTPKIGEEKFSQSYLKDLTDQLKKELKTRMKKNEGKIKRMATSYPSITIIFITMFVIVAFNVLRVIGTIIDNIFSYESLTIVIVVLIVVIITKSFR